MFFLLLGLGNFCLTSCSRELSFTKKNHSIADGFLGRSLEDTEPPPITLPPIFGLRPSTTPMSVSVFGENKLVLEKKVITPFPTTEKYKSLGTTALISKVYSSPNVEIPNIRAVMDYEVSSRAVLDISFIERLLFSHYSETGDQERSERNTLAAVTRESLRMKQGDQTESQPITSTTVVIIRNRNERRPILFWRSHPK